MDGATAIFTGQIPIIGEGLNEVIDFDFTNKETIVSAEKKWNADTSDPLGDLERWREAVQKEGFVNCNICIMAKDVANAFVNNAKVKSVLDVRAYDLAVIKPRELRTDLPTSALFTSWALTSTSTTSGIWTTGPTPTPRHRSRLFPTARLPCCLPKRSIPSTTAQSP